MNRRGFFAAAATALVLPYEPKRVYSFPKPGHELVTNQEWLERAQWEGLGDDDHIQYLLPHNVGRDGQILTTDENGKAVWVDHSALAELADDDHAQYLCARDLAHGNRLYGSFCEHIQRVIEAKGFCVWPTDKDYILLERPL